MVKKARVKAGLGSPLEFRKQRSESEGAELSGVYTWHMRNEEGATFRGCPEELTRLHISLLAKNNQELNLKTVLLSLLVWLSGLSTSL